MANPFKRLFSRNQPTQKRFAVVGSDKELQETLATLGYTTLDKSP